MQAEQRTEFDYLLNRYTAAAQADKPAEHKFKTHHDALYAYVRDLECRAALSHPSPQGWKCPKCGIEREGPYPACMQDGCPTSPEQGSNG